MQSKSKTVEFGAMHEVQRWKADHPNFRIEKEGPPPPPEMRPVVRGAKVTLGPHYVWRITYVEG
jgi:hypothetical protein